LTFQTTYAKLIAVTNKTNMSEQAPIPQPTPEDDAMRQHVSDMRAAGQMPPEGEWDKTAYHRRDKRGDSVRVNALYAGINSPIDPEFPGTADMHRTRYDLEPRVESAEVTDEPEQEVIEELGSLAIEAVVEKPAVVLSGVPEKPDSKMEEIAATLQPSLSTVPKEPSAELPDLSKLPSETNPPEAKVTNNEMEEMTGRDRAMQDLREQWGLPAEATIDDALRQLDTTFEGLQKLQLLTGGESELEPSLTDLKRRLYDSIQYNSVNFNTQHVHHALELLQRLQMEMQQVRSSRLLPARGHDQFETPAYMLNMTINTLDNVMPREGFMDTDAVYSAWRLLEGGNIDDIRRITAGLQNEIEQKRIDLMGYAAATESQDQTQAEQFADDRIQELARSLRKEGVSDDDVQKAVIAMERYLDDAITNATNDTSIGFIFPERVVRNGENDKAKREGGAKEGQSDSPRQVAAEYAVDMVRGAFDASKGEIVIGSDGKTVDFGQKRAAALMTLYGKNWVQAGQAAGHKIVTERR
jgi:hypothetical protein